MTKQNFFYNTLIGKLLSSNERERIVCGILDRVKPKESFLDMGCASGHYVEKMVPKCSRCAGVDLDEEDIEHACGNVQGGEFYCGDATALSRFNKNEFDWVLCSEVLEHIPDWKKALDEIKRVVRKNVLITIPLEKSVFWKTVSFLQWKKKHRGHVHELSSQDVVDEMQEYEVALKRYVFAPVKWLNEKFADSENEKWAIYAVLWFRKSSA